MQRCNIPQPQHPAHDCRHWCKHEPVCGWQPSNHSRVRQSFNVSAQLLVQKPILTCTHSCRSAAHMLSPPSNHSCVTVSWQCVLPRWHALQFLHVRCNCRELCCIQFPTLEVAQGHCGMVQLWCCGCVCLVHAVPAKQGTVLGQVGVDLRQLSKESLLLDHLLIRLQQTTAWRNKRWRSKTACRTLACCGGCVFDSSAKKAFFSSTSSPDCKQTPARNKRTEELERYKA